MPQSPPGSSDLLVLETTNGGNAYASSGERWPASHMSVPTDVRVFDSEPEAAAVHCANLTDVHKLGTGQNFMICDAGGGTVVRIVHRCPRRPRVANGAVHKDLAVYKIIGMLSNLEIAEMCARSGANCGSLFLDLRFRELMRTLLADHPVHLDAISLANFMEHFSETEKLRYTGAEDDGKCHSAHLTPPCGCRRYSASSAIIY